MKRLALVAVLLLAGCGGTQPRKPVQPHLARSLAEPWRAQADAVAAALAAGDGCLARERATALRASVLAAVDARRLPPRFQKPLLGAVDDLAARIRCVPPAPPPPSAPAGHGHGHGKPPKQHGRGHGKGHGKK